jgi:multiple sugar transport system ATP-binding protein
MTAEQLDGYVGRDVRVGIRPQYFRVANDPSEGIPAQHVLDEPLGDETHSFFETEFGELVVVTDSDFEGERREYGLVIDAEEAQLFDPESGVRIA